MNHSVPVLRPRRRRQPFLPVGWLGLILFGASLASGAEPAADADGLAFFETKIRPVLAERCYKCHSATSEKLKGGLQLDSRAGLLHGGDTRAAIVPGEPEKSLMMEAIRYGNPDLQMPPKQRLSAAEVADFATWIKAGAPWPAGGSPAGKIAAFDLAARRQQHWSWQPIKPVTPPSVQDSAWPVTSVDRFLLARLEAAKLSPAPPADPRTMIRRVYFDLTGLPPTPAQVEAFLADSSPAAFAPFVDRLLASPQYGERWARHWLDLVRYSETLGHEFDYVNFNAWRYRDYVIRAFNADVPYPDFVTEQIAGDLLAHPRRHPTESFNESVIGPAYYWFGQRSHSPVDVRLDQAETVDNQIDVTSKAFLGLTVACARCHDHKFDAISTRDYYSLYGVFGSSRYAQCALDPAEKLAAETAALRSLKLSLRPLLGTVWQQEAGQVAEYLLAAQAVGAPTGAGALSNQCVAVAAARHLNAPRLEQWVHALADNAVTRPNHPLYAWSKLAGLTNAATGDVFRERLKTVLAELAHSAGRETDANAGTSFGDFGGPDFAGWTVSEEAFGAAPVPAGDFVVGDARRPVLACLRAPAASSAAISRRLEGVLRSPTFIITNRYAHILAAGSGGRVNVRVDNFTMIRDPIYGGLKHNLNRESLQWLTIDLETWRGHRAFFEFADQVTPDPSEDPGQKYNSLAYLAVSRVVFSEQGTPPADSSARPEFLPLGALAKVTSPDELAVCYQQAITAAVQSWSNGQGGAPETLAWLEWLLPHSLLESTHPDAPAPQQLATLVNEFRTREDALPERTRTLGMVDGTGVDENVFIRGSHRTLGPVVPRRFLEALGGSEQNRFTQGSGRLELAQRITDPANPFLARVMVNRVWLHLFGRGIVPTPDDFGVLGQPPTHPELLDWLANWYATEGGWSTKRLIRFLVTSRAYQMASRPADARAEEQDPQNLLLHRMPVRRLEGEAIRDAILAVSGRLDPALYGPPVPIYLTEFMEGRGRPGHSGPLDGAGRRSIYQEVRRNFLPPMMRAFDFPVPASTVGRRTASNVPAQSLMLMNDPFVTGEAKRWAQSVLAPPDRSPEQRIQAMYETIFSRPPRAEELASAQSFLARQGEAYGLDPARRNSDVALWADLAHVLMNVKEFVFLN